VRPNTRHGDSARVATSVLRAKGLEADSVRGGHRALRMYGITWQIQPYIPHFPSRLCYDPVSQVLYSRGTAATELFCASISFLSLLLFFFAWSTGILLNYFIGLGLLLVSTHAEQLEARATVDTVVSLTCGKMWKEAEQYSH
jgi:hypothetical protein